MNRFTANKDYQHGDSLTTAVVLVQLGTPTAPTAKALREYLAEFLADPRVVEIPAAVWRIILHGVILRVRPNKSAAKYKSIWTDEGSPLRVYTEKQVEAVKQSLGNDVEVIMAMRYGEPSIKSVLKDLQKRNLRKLLVLPMYPQYSGPTTATVFDEVIKELKTWRNLPEFRFIRNFHDDAMYIDAVASGIEQAWQERGRPEKLVMSFHGVPKRTLTLGDPYHCECLKTARLLGERLGISKDDYVVTFQSRFGSAEWLQPYTEPTLVKMAQEGVKSVDVVCPGFIADCLETLEEISQEACDAFLHAGGQQFNYIPCVNDSQKIVQTLNELIKTHTHGW
jgi:protoporphyrin/coproporphyrin ferrochelatase